MIYTLKSSFYKHGYLLIIAAWLYTISFIFSNYYYYQSTPNRIKKQIENYLQANERRFTEFSKDSAVLKTIINPYLKPKVPAKWVNKDLGIFVYTTNATGSYKLNYWSTNEILPAERELFRPDGKFFSGNGNKGYEIIKKSVIIDKSQVVIVASIPVQNSYIIENRYLKTYIPAVQNLAKKYNIVFDDADFYVNNGDGKRLCGFKENKTIQSNNNETWSVAFKILSVLFVLVFLNVFSGEVVDKKGWIKGVMFLVVSIIVLRLLSYYFPFPFQFNTLPLFDPIIYASNGFNRSLGDLFINIILIFWLVSFIKFAAINYVKNVKSVKGKQGWYLTAIMCALLILISFTSAGIIRSLIIDSKIPLDVSNFLSLNIYSLLSFIILCFIVLTFLHFSHIILLLIDKAVDVPFYGRYLSLTVAGLLYLTIELGKSASSSNIIVLLWLLCYMLIMEFRKEDFYIPILRSSFFVIWLIFFAASISALIISQNKVAILQRQKSVAETLVTKADPTYANLMNQDILNIDTNFLSANYHRFFNEGSNKLIKDSLIRETFNGYLNQFELRLYTFDKNYNPLYNDDSIPYGILYSTYINRSKRTDVYNIRYYESPDNNFSYLYKEDLKDNKGKTLGYFFIVAETKKYKSDALTPELFKQDQGTDDLASLYSAYAVYNRGRLEMREGDYNFRSVLFKQDIPKQTFLQKEIDGNTELWYNAGKSRVVILVKKSSVFFASIALFAYLFGSFLLVVILFQAGLLLLRLRFRLNNLQQVLNLNIRTQIHGAIIFISIFSFLVIGIATIYFYITRYEQTNRERLVKTIEVMENDIKAHAAYNKVSENSAITDITDKSGLEKVIRQVANSHSIDVNYYDLNGRLKYSSIPFLYQKRILSLMMDPQAYESLHFNNEIQFIKKENVSDFTYMSVYAPISDANGTPSAYINIPYLNTQNQLKQEISNFLVTLINLNAFIFVVAGAISVFFTNRITNSFKLIATKMKDINLGKANEEITWNTKDEIGALVNEYNKMVKKLEESANALAKSEREGAWREMARQVAHEIKNPLTPMKLSIQYLQNAIKDKKPNIQLLSEKVTATLVEQIDQLAKIASDFSQFAHIGNVIIEEFDVNDLLESLVNLYQSNEKLHLVFERPAEPAIIRADRSQINRLFTNLLQNAMEASTGDQITSIVIKEEINANKLLINVKDNGCGIPLEKQSKIFTPNFTTKSSGTGLGLAISKGIVEKANGRIWFDTEEGKGSTFHVLLPLVNIPS